MNNKTKIWTLVLIAGLCLFSGGCGNHKKNKEASVENWHAARNNIALELAGKQAQNGQLDKAIVTVQDALEKSPEFINGWLMLAQLYQQKDLPTASQSCLDQALKLKPEHPEANYQMGMAMEVIGESDKALACYDKAVTNSPDSLDYTLAKANLLSQIGRSEEALKLLQEQISKNRNNPAVFMMAGNIHATNGQVSESVGMYKLALKYDPKNASAANKLITGLMKSQLYQQAIEEIIKQQINQERKSDSFLTLALGDCYLYTGQLIMSQRCYETLIRDVGAKDEYLIRLAQVAIARNDLDRAQQSCTRVLQKKPQDNEASLLLATVHLKKQQYSFSCDLSQSVIDRDQNDPLAWCILGRSYSGLGDLEKAKECYSKAESLSPNSPLARDLLKEVEQLRLSESNNHDIPELK